MFFSTCATAVPQGLQLQRRLGRALAVPDAVKGALGPLVHTLVPAAWGEAAAGWGAAASDAVSSRLSDALRPHLRIVG